MRLIFIEGVSGVGKSTATIRLRDFLRGRGYSADGYLEGEKSNPIDLYWCAHLSKAEYERILASHCDFAIDITTNTICMEDYVLIRYQDFDDTNNSLTRFYSAELYDFFKEREVCYKAKNPVPFDVFTKVFSERWKNFLSSESAKRDFIIFDGAFLAHQINDIIRNYKSTDDEIIQFLELMWGLVKEHNPIVLYLESQDIWGKIRSACIKRGHSIPPKEQTAFWENRKRIDLLALGKLPVESQRYDITDGNWDLAINMMKSRILETDEERRARIYPIILSEYNPAWPEWFADEKATLERLLCDNIVSIHHIGSTAVPGLMAKPTIDILLEIKEAADIDKLIAVLPSPEYICLRGEGLTISTPPPHLRFIKGYLPDGFAEKVFHIHVVYTGDEDSRNKLSFRDYLIAHPETAAEYAALKRCLLDNYEHDRDGYTNEKGEFVRKTIKNAQED